MYTRSKLAFAGLVATGSFFAVQTVLAHHSSAGFRSDEVSEITGTIREFQFQNPHSWIQVMVAGDGGGSVEWSVEWGSPNNLVRQGYTPQTFPEGAEVTIRLNPAVSGAPMGGFVAAQFPDGTTVGNWSD